MATYVLPQALVFQDFELTPAAIANPLRACVVGPHAQLVRFDETDERSDGFLDYYDRLLETCYDFPNREAGGVVDTSYVKVFMEDALLRYFNDPLGSGSTITKVSGSNNKVSSDSVNFAENVVGSTTYSRDSSLLDRDVQAGDIARVRAVVGMDEYVTWTYVKDIEGDEVSAVVDSAQADTDNASSQSASSTVTQIDGAHNCITLTPDESGYDGLADGDIDETYTILVTESSSDGDLATATLRVISASGNDDVAEVTPSAAGASTDIGTRGLTVTFDTSTSDSCSTSASEDGVLPDDLIVGQKWEVAIEQDFTAPTATSGGSYSGDTDTTYIIEVTRGGLYTATEAPQISVTTTTGVDKSGPTNVTAASSDVVVGTDGVTVQFDATGLRKGDKYYIGVTAAFESDMRTLVLGNNLPDEVVDATEVGVSLYILKPELEIDENREGFAPLVNWEVTTTGTPQICLKDGIIAYDESWTDSGVMQPLDVHSEESKGYGKAYVEYRAWLPDLCSVLRGIDDVSDIDDISGPLHPDNPLKWGVFKALSNSNGVEVKYLSACDPDDSDSWDDALEIITGREDVYGLVPLTRDQTVLDLFASHVDAMSTAEQGLWRVAWFNIDGIPEKVIVDDSTSSDGNTVLAVLEDDPATSGTQYTRLRVPASNSQFVTDGVQAGDIIRYLFTGDGFGNETYTEFVVDTVVSEDELLLLTGHTAPVNVAQKVEVWRNLTPTEEASEIAAKAGAWANRRIRAVWPDTIESSGTIQEGYHLCAALAGLSSGVVPHQGLTNLEIAGFTDVSRTVDKFNRTQLDTMAVAGTWIVTQNVRTGEVFSRHAVTTDDYEEVNLREEMVTRNVDSISFRFKDSLAPFIGVSNATDSMLRKIEATIRSLIEVLKAETFVPNLGGQLGEATEILQLRRHTTLKDRFVAVLSADVPVALNNVEVHLVI